MRCGAGSRSDRLELGLTPRSSRLKQVPGGIPAQESARPSSPQHCGHRLLGGRETAETRDPGGLAAAQRVTRADARVAEPRWSRYYLAPSYHKGESQHAYALQVLARLLGGGETSRAAATGSPRPR